MQYEVMCAKKSVTHVSSTNLCDHATNVSSVGREQDCVGLFGQVGKSSHILLGHTQGRCGVSVL